MNGIERAISVRQRPQARLAVRVAAACIGAVFASDAVAAGTYKWTDEQGVVHYSDKAPAETPAKGATVLDKQGRPVKKIDPPLTPEQIKAKADEEERVRALAKAKDVQARKDRALMQSYTSESEIDIAKKSNLSMSEQLVEMAKLYAQQRDAVKAKDVELAARLSVRVLTTDHRLARATPLAEAITGPY